jgi:hypothetical protein
MPLPLGDLLGLLRCHSPMPLPLMPSVMQLFFFGHLRNLN